MSDCSTNGEGVEVLNILRHIGCTSARMYTQFTLIWSEVCVLVLFIVCCWCCCAFCKLAFCFDSLALQSAMTAVAPVQLKAQRNAEPPASNATGERLLGLLRAISPAFTLLTAAVLLLAGARGHRER
eukprot:19692-Heterococcus_DN1.PRE.2